MTQRFIRMTLCAVAAATVSSTIGMAGAARGDDATGAPTIKLYDSPHFRLHTDVPDAEAVRTLSRMETALARAAEYWGRQPRGQIGCYLAANVTAWPEDALPHPLARVWIGAVGGATVRSAEHHGRTAARDVTIYSSTRPGIVEHEVIHAYCCQAFGATGPDWYKEGMAQVVAYAADGEPGLHCPPEVLAELKNKPAKTIVEIVRAGQFTNRTVRSLDSMLDEREDPARPLLMADWTNQHSEDLSDLREPYSWSWALCHFLANNPNYASRFRRLGERFLVDQRDASAALLGPVHKQAAFEFAQFVRNAAPGYPTELCAWEWDKRFQNLGAGKSISRRIRAARGYQASGLAVQAGQTIAFRTIGRWTAVPEVGPTDADGAADGSGQLVATVLDDYRLSEPIPLGAHGRFIAPSDGHLYLRCGEAWNRLADNSGSITVRLSRVGP